MSGFLAEMAAGSHARVREAKTRLSESALAERARCAAPPPPLRLSAAGFDLIAELKLRSPAAGALGGAGTSIAARVTAYATAGAAAVSVLTEPSRFDGSLAHLGDASRALAPLGVPAMRKDFLIDPYQVLEARVAGAGGVLVILRMLSPESLSSLLECARAYGLFVLLVGFDVHDLERMRELIAADAGRGTLLAGVNCRDLATLEVLPERLIELAPQLPRGVPCAAESGVESAADARRLAAAGYGLILVGSALMRGGDPAGLARELLDAGRAARRAA